MFDTGTLDTETTLPKGAEHSPGFEPLDVAALDLEALDLVPLDAITPDPPGHPGGMRRVPNGIDAMAAGVFLAALLASIDVTRISGYDRIRVLRAHQRMASHYQARLYHDMAAVPSYLVDEDDEDQRFADEAAAAEIRAALRLTRRAADSELSVALELQRRLPRVRDALVAGRIDVRRAKAMVHGTVHVPDTAARAVVDEVLDDAPRLTTGQLAARLRKLCVAVNPDDARDRYAVAVDERRVVMEPTTDGTANLLGLNLPPHRAAAATRHINRLARSLRGAHESRTIDQLRVDVLLDLLTGTGHAANQAAKHGRGGSGKRGVVDIRVDLTTLAGLSDTPGELAGYGPVIADIARQVADHQTRAEWRWTLTDPETGLPIATGTTRRRPAASQRRLVEAANPTCIFPGCRMPSTTCDLDHRQPWSEDGPTEVANLAPLCRHDHRIRHEHGWTNQALTGGDYLWTSPLGHRYTTSGRSP